MMKPLPNSRQIPTDEEITSQKTYFDKLYGYLQAISEKDEASGQRFFRKPSYKEIHETILVSEDTIAKHFKELESSGLIIKSSLQKKIYFLKCFPSNEAYLIPKETIHYLACTQKQHTITIYVYLLRRFVANKEKEFMFTIDNLKNICGECITSRANNDKYRFILSTLRDIGLIDCELRTIVENNIPKKHWYCTMAKQTYTPFRKFN